MTMLIGLHLIGALIYGFGIWFWMSLYLSLSLQPWRLDLIVKLIIASLLWELSAVNILLHKYYWRTKC